MAYNGKKMKDREVKAGHHGTKEKEYKEKDEYTDGSAETQREDQTGAV